MIETKQKENHKNDFKVGDYLKRDEKRFNYLPIVKVIEVNPTDYLVEVVQDTLFPCGKQFYIDRVHTSHCGFIKISDIERALCKR